MRSSSAPSMPGRRARLLIGLLFLALAGFWAWVALSRTSQEPRLTVTVRVLDHAGAPLKKAQVRTRYGGSWIDVGPGASVELHDPRTRAAMGQVEAALADALEARAAFHAARRGSVANVKPLGPGAYEATLRLEPCGQLRLGVAPSGFPGARATVDPDGPAERWRLIEGHDIVRAGEAATYAVFAGAPPLWVTLEGDRGVAQVRLELPAPGVGQLLERSLGPEQALPIRGRIVLPEGAWAPSLHGVLEVTELREGAPPIPRSAVRVEPDGSFAVEYAGRGRFELTARLPFASVRLPAGAAAGDEQVAIPAEARPWIEVGPAALAREGLRVSLFGAGSDDLLPPGGAIALERGLAVAVPAAGTYRVLLAARGTDERAPRSGEAEVLVPAEGSVVAEVLLAERPHGTVVVEADPVPAPGGEVRLAPDRSRTLLPNLAPSATFAHVPVGQALLSASWRDPAYADELFVAEVQAGESTRVRLVPVPGGRVRIHLAGTWAEHEAKALVLRIAANTSPYGPAEGLLPLAREGATPIVVPRAALRPGAYRATLERAGEGRGPTLAVAFTIASGTLPEVQARQP